MLAVGCLTSRPCPRHRVGNYGEPGRGESGDWRKPHPGTRPSISRRGARPIRREDWSHREGGGSVYGPSDDGPRRPRDCRWPFHLTPRGTEAYLRHLREGGSYHARWSLSRIRRLVRRVQDLREGLGRERPEAFNRSSASIDMCLHNQRTALYSLTVRGNGDFKNKLIYLRVLKFGTHVTY